MFNFAGSAFITKFVQLIKGKLSKVATSGSYNDLSDKPTIPSADGFMTKENPVGSGSFSINRQTGSTVGTNSVTFGSNNIASGENSVAEGENNIALGKNQHIFGENNKTDDDSILIAGNGYSSLGRLIRHNAFWLKENGDGYFSGDVYAKDPTVPSSESDTPVIRLARINEIPTTLPADGGNADTVGDKPASDFIYARGFFNSIDLDDIKYPCSGLALNCAHVPSDQWGTLLVYAGGTGSFAQIFLPTANDNTPTVMYFRHFGGTGWTAWAEVVTTASYNALTEEYLLDTDYRLSCLELGL